MTFADKAQSVRALAVMDSVAAFTFSVLNKFHNFAHQFMLISGMSRKRDNAKATSHFEMAQVTTDAFGAQFFFDTLSYNHRS
jgi:hypothetical protein